jgi:hypothetical protein
VSALFDGVPPAPMVELEAPVPVAVPASVAALPREVMPESDDVAGWFCMLDDVSGATDPGEVVAPLLLVWA